MNYSIVDVCNMALGQIKVRTIISLEDATQEALQCKTLFPLCLSELLMSANWSFAKVIRNLAEIDYSILDKDFLSRERNFFEYPSDVVRLRRVTSRGRDIPYDILSVKTTEGAMQVIASDIDRLTIEYTRYAEDINNWPPLFLRAFVHYLAYTIAPVLAADSNALQTQLQLYAMTFKQAQAGNTNENKHIFRPDDSILRERWR